MCEYIYERKFFLLLRLTFDHHRFGPTSPARRMCGRERVSLFLYSTEGKLRANGISKSGHRDAFHFPFLSAESYLIPDGNVLEAFFFCFPSKTGS